MTDIITLSKKIAAATEAGKIAAAAQLDDGGSANLDHVVIFGLKGVREAALLNAGIDCRKRGVGKFALGAPFAGQGNRRAAGVEAQADALNAAGVQCYVHYQMD
ncbi:hypothetical protein [Salipiger thiooxidans]|uniref:hypothetical protein n=1 Tax=Salipiger thiooxidans TaxID=282683 RepID=UPI001CD2850D|nr:hypothetical protein [Salipiger thiooxidans]MCA0846101.1 hypothetical protein [Salipiger thiooxidans]